VSLSLSPLLQLDADVEKYDQQIKELLKTGRKDRALLVLKLKK
jgi:hypothetical protein